MRIPAPCTWVEAEQAAHAGVKRRLLALFDGRPARYGFKESDTWGSDIESCGAEQAVARHVNQYWTPYARRPAEVTADVGENIQVRRRSERTWDLIVHPDDHDDHVFYLVVGEIPNFEIIGCITGREAKQPEFWGDPYHTGRPAFWIPQDRLA